MLPLERVEEGEYSFNHWREEGEVAREEDAPLLEQQAGQQDKHILCLEHLEQQSERKKWDGEKKDWEENS